MLRGVWASLCWQQAVHDYFSLSFCFFDSPASFPHLSNCLHADRWAFSSEGEGEGVSSNVGAWQLAGINPQHPQSYSVYFLFSCILSCLPRNLWPSLDQGPCLGTELKDTIWRTIPSSPKLSHTTQFKISEMCYTEHQVFNEAEHFAAGSL